MISIAPVSTLTSYCWCLGHRREDNTFFSASLNWPILLVLEIRSPAMKEMSGVNHGVFTLHICCVLTLSLCVSAFLLFFREKKKIPERYLLRVLDQFSYDTRKIKTFQEIQILNLAIIGSAPIINIKD